MMSRLLRSSSASKWSMLFGILVIAALLFFLKNVDWRDTLDLLRGTDRKVVFFLLPTIILTVWVLRALRWCATLDVLHVKIGFFETYLFSSLAIALGAVTPAQTGELVKAGFARRLAGVEIYDSLGLYAAERVFDVLFLLGLTVIGLSFSGVALPLWSTAFFIAASGAAWFSCHWLYAKGRLPVFLSAPYKTFLRALRVPRFAALLALLTLACWLATGGLWSAAFSAVHIELSYPAVLTIVGLVTIANLASFLPGGLGTTEAGVTGALLLFGQSVEAAAAGAIMIRITGLLAIMIGAAHWLVYRSVRGRLQSRGKFEEELAKR